MAFALLEGRQAMTTLNKLLALAALVLPGLASCTDTEDGQDCSEGKCDVPDSQVPASPCDGIIKDRSGANHQRVAGRNNDALSKLIFQKGDSCPTSFQQMMAALRKNDTQGCSGERDGLETRFVSETAQAGGDVSYRTVTSRACNNRSANTILFSQFASPGQTKMSANAEIISFDESQGVFNFYDTDGSSMNFFGSSKDFVVSGPGSGQTRRCAQCHPGGGLNMKELDSPWINWEGHIPSPGTDDIVNAIPDLGSKASGIEFEGTVNAGNDKWNKARVDIMKANGDVQAMLKPLFCTVEINFGNGSAFSSPVAGGRGGDELSSVPFKSLVDTQLKSFGSVPVTFTDYDDLIKANGQRLEGVPNAIDTIIDYIFIERSHLDNDYVDKLKSAGILDDKLVKDVLMVDFTRPIFSDDRCGLLTFVPKKLDKIDAASIRDGLRANLESESPAAGSPGAVLLANLKAADTKDNDAKVDAFLNACKGLGSKPFLQNAMQIVSLNRNKARELPIIEGASQLPADDQNVDSAARLDPKSCTVTNQFVAP
jgi:hypothetical protein